MTRRLALLIVGAALAITTTPHAQAPQRDAVAPSLVGAASITGMVVTDDADARPVRLAKVTLQNAARAPVTTTDDAGRFTVSRLPAGRYTVVVSKAGFVTATYGAKRAGSSGVPVILADGDHADVTVRLPRGAVIAGAVRTSAGDPIANATITLYTNGYLPNGERGLSSQTFSNSGNGSLRTDAHGNYRVYGLHPDTYVVAVRPYFSPGGGRLVTSAELDWAQRLMTSPGSPAPEPPHGSNVASSATFYPNVIDASAATPIVLAAGDERTDVDITADYVPTATVSGIVLDPDGRPPRVTQVTLVDPNAPFGLNPGGGFIRPDAEGHFSASGILPGNYVLAARGSAGTGDAVAADTASTMPFLAMQDVRVSGQDITGLEVRLGSGAALSARAALEGTTAKPPDLTRINVLLFAYQQTGATTMAPPATPINADGTVTLHGIGPGRYKVSVNTAGAPGWTASSAMINGIDAIDGPLDIGRADVDGLVITLTDHPTELSGSLLTREGKPAPQYVLVVASTNPAHWVAGSRRVRSVRPANTGGFRVTGLPPGEYYLVALTDLEQSRIYTREYLEPLVAQGMKITLADGEKKVQDFKVAGGG
jgi:hypothetical protein